ncbi:MAG TPA: PQQ-binding-like beta-propeller repeat protein, partial [Lacipirellulaceae bacterium]|nr:PQQ-binding-like beta-propeller repeat protein [Lacipirellulaceae bacterium]
PAPTPIVVLFDASTMAFDDQLVAASGNEPEPLMLVVDAGGTGDVTDTHILWSAAKENPYVPSPLVVDQRLLLVTDGGVASCRDLRTGRVLWKKRLGGNFSASPVLAANHVYAINEDGVTYVFRTEPEFELVARNDLGQRCLATPAMCGNRIFVRTEGHLYCIRGAQQPAPQ